MNNLQVAFIIIGSALLIFGINDLLKLFKGYGLFGGDRADVFWFPKIGYFRTTKTKRKINKARLLMSGLSVLLLGLLFLLMSFAKY